jgi:UDP-glucose 4-epimerase
MKKILITGGNGFIGSHTATLLSENNYLVDILDNFHNSDPQNFLKIKAISPNNINLI